MSGNCIAKYGFMEQNKLNRIDFVIKICIPNKQHDVNLVKNV
jgi:hypothetical protein